MNKLLLLTILLLPMYGKAQKVKLVQSASTSWSGGIPGKHGTNYEFLVEFSEYTTNEPEPDTLWIGNRCIPLVLRSDPGISYNLTKLKGKKKVTFQVRGATTEADDEHPIRYNPVAEEQKTVKLLPPIPYRGVALMSYRYKDKKNYFVINKIMTVGTPINYP